MCYRWYILVSFFFIWVINVGIHWFDMLLGKRRRDLSLSHPSLVQLKQNQAQRLYLSSVSNLLSSIQFLERLVSNAYCFWIVTKEIKTLGRNWLETMSREFLLSRTPGLPLLVRSTKIINDTSRLTWRWVCTLLLIYLVADLFFLAIPRNVLYRRRSCAWWAWIYLD